MHMLWIFITVPLALFVIAMVVTPLVVTISREERDQRRLSLDEAVTGDLRRMETRPDVTEALRRSA